MIHTGIFIKDQELVDLLFLKKKKTRVRKLAKQYNIDATEISAMGEFLRKE